MPQTTPGTAIAVEPEALVLSYWFDSGEAGRPYSTTVRFTGRRAGVQGKPQSADSFLRDEIVDPVIPGTGPVTITSWIYGLNRGEWSVSAELIGESPRSADADRTTHVTRPRSRAVEPATWSWRRWAVTTKPTGIVRTRWAPLAPLAPMPAVIPGVYTALAVISIVVALLVQWAILSTENVSSGRPLAASTLAIALGLVGAKLWYVVLHPDESLIRGGWAVDGFLIVAPLVAVGAMHVLALPMGTVLDAATPGIFFAVAIGRIGCFLAGCCAGRPTDSRWGIWSTDRRVGARRIPTQLLESAAGLGLALASTLLVIAHVIAIPGLTFVIVFATYAVVRQVLLRLRAEQRKAARTLSLTAGAAAALMISIAVMSVVEDAAAPSHTARGSRSSADRTSTAIVRQSEPLGIGESVSKAG